MRSTAIVQARMGSTRLPGKVLRDLGGRPVLSWVVRAARDGDVDCVGVATTTLPEDDALVGWCHAHGVDVVRGASEDVLARYVSALDEWSGETIVRLTADCPLLDPQLIAAAVDAFEAGGTDYVCTVVPRTLPRGLDVEVVSASALRRIDRQATGYHRAHVTSYIREHPGEFAIRGLEFSPRADDLRVTLDTEEDTLALEAIVAELGDRPPAWREVVEFLRARPDIVALNAHVRQKSLEEG